MLGDEAVAVRLPETLPSLDPIRVFCDLDDSIEAKDIDHDLVTLWVISTVTNSLALSPAFLVLTPDSDESIVCPLGFSLVLLEILFVVIAMRQPLDAGADVIDSIDASL